jgi:hypothetical protein
MRNPMEFLQRARGQVGASPVNEKRTLTFMAVSAAIMVGLSLFGGSLPSSGGGGDIVKGMFVIGVTIAGYFFPSILAKTRGHPNVLAIFLLNLLLGWTGLGWIGALIWAVIAIPAQPEKETK